MAIGVLIILLLLLGTLLYGIQRARGRVKATTAKLDHDYGLLSEAVKYVQTIYYNVQSGKFYNAYGSSVPQEGITEDDIEKQLLPDDAKRLRKLRVDIADGSVDSERVSFQWNIGSGENPDWHHFRAFVLAEKHKGKVDNIFYTLYDVTDDVKRQGKIQQLSWIFEHIFEQSAAGQAYYDGSGKLLHINPMMGLIFGQIYDLSQINESNLFDMDPFTGLRSPDNVEPLYVCTRFERKEEGSNDIFLEIRFYPVRDNAGNLLFLGVNVVDVSEVRNIYLESRRKRKEIKDASDEAKALARQLSYLLQFGKLTLWKLDKERNRYVLKKDFFHDHDGMDVDGVADILSEDTRPVYQAAVEKVRAGVRDPISVMVHVKTEQPKEIDKWLTITAVPKEQEDGTLQYFGLQRDVTDLIRMEEELRRQAEIANDSARLKSLFLANMSHEIRTPLNAIVGFSDMLGLMEGEEQKEFIDIIKRNSEMLLRLINDILALSKAESGGLSSEPKEVDFAKQFNNIYVSLKERMTSATVEILEDNPYESLVINVDMERIQQVINNFAINASKYTKEGHIKIGYSLKEDNQLYVYCEDTGEGIPKDKQKEIFEKFVKLNSFVQGTGLGLSICKAIADGCGGKIGVDSEPGTGSTFWIQVPYTTGDDKQ